MQLFKETEKASSLLYKLQDRNINVVLVLGRCCESVPFAMAQIRFHIVFVK